MDNDDEFDALRGPREISTYLRGEFDFKKFLELLTFTSKRIDHTKCQASVSNWCQREYPACFYFTTNYL